ncbi:MAG: peptidoglycan-binding protein [Oscillospiraceae bacterium]|jgi:hypothetical protein|nr:peptidoglycan-binding protein [Oscillospiraceae bacterium]
MRKRPSKLPLCTAIVLLLLVLVTVLALQVTASSAQLGDGGDEVRQIQTQLTQRGFYSGNADGLYSPALTGAVRAFQTSESLPENGKADAATLAALFPKKAPQSNAEKLLARHIAAQSMGRPYWEQLACGRALLERLRQPESPRTLAALLCADGSLPKLLRVTPDAASQQAAAECLNGK